MKDIENVILFQIEQASKVAKQHSQREMDRLKIGITVEQWILLKIISESESLSQKELALKSSRDPASITRTLDLLTKKELIIRESIPNNRRGYHVVLSKEGKAFIQKHLPLIHEFRKQSVKGLSVSELEELSRMLLKIKDNMT